MSRSVAPVFGIVGEELVREVTAFWLENGAMKHATEARRRTDELVCLARNGAGEIVGLLTGPV